MNLEDEKEQRDAEKLIKKEFRAEILNILKSFPCFTAQRDLYLYSRKFYSELFQNKPAKYHEAEILEFFEQAIRKSRTFLSKSDTKPFNAYLYIVKVYKAVINTEKEDLVDEGEFL